MTQFYNFKIEQIKDLSLDEKVLRRKNLDLFHQNGFPNKKNEDWKFTDLNSILSKNFDNIVNDEKSRLKEFLNTEQEILSKIKKTYKNRYFIQQTNPIA